MKRRQRSVRSLALQQRWVNKTASAKRPLLGSATAVGEGAPSDVFMRIFDVHGHGLVFLLA